ncbi:hypothetical protein Tco_0446871 [Tanacetum coccineum]
MPPRRFKKKYVRKIVEKRVAKAIEKSEKTRTDSNNAGGSGSTNTGGTVVPEMHGCLYKTFMNGCLFEHSLAKNALTLVHFTNPISKIKECLAQGQSGSEWLGKWVKVTEPILVSKIK